MAVEMMLWAPCTSPLRRQVAATCGAWTCQAEVILQIWLQKVQSGLAKAGKWERVFSFCQGS